MSTAGNTSSNMPCTGLAEGDRDRVDRQEGAERDQQHKPPHRVGGLATVRLRSSRPSAPSPSRHARPIAITSRRQCQPEGEERRFGARDEHRCRREGGEHEREAHVPNGAGGPTETERHRIPLRARLPSSSWRTSPPRSPRSRRVARSTSLRHGCDSNRGVRCEDVSRSEAAQPSPAIEQLRLPTLLVLFLVPGALMTVAFVLIAPVVEAPGSRRSPRC